MLKVNFTSFIMNYCLVTLRLDIFLPLRWLISSCECPHRLSDKLLKSSELRAFVWQLEVAYITLSSFSVNRLFHSVAAVFNLSRPGYFVMLFTLFPVDGAAL